MRLLDLFCGAGGAAMGYHRAGFTDITGIDINPQPHYPFRFIQGDVFEAIASLDLTQYDMIHASPPCQAFTKLSALGKARNGSYPDHSDLVDATRKVLQESGSLYVIENVVGAPLINPIMLCGAQFGLKVYRHRLFETNFFILSPQHFPHHDSTPSAGNGCSPKGFISVCGTGGVKGMTASEILAYWSMAMGIDWMNRRELSQAIPPAYTEFIGWLYRSCP